MRVFKKTIKGVVGGRYINARDEYDEFLLKGDPNTAPIEDITVEVAEGEAEKYFLKQNKGAITHGYLVELVDGYEIEVDTVNSVSDGYLKDLLKQPVSKMKKRVEEFTSPIPVGRLLDIAKEQNKPVKTIKFLTDTLNRLKGNPTDLSQISNVTSV